MVVDSAASLWALVGWLQLVERELLLFVLFWFLVGLVDEFAIDLIWIGLRLAGRSYSARLPEEFGSQQLSGPMAVIIAAWHEHEVIGATLSHMLASWPQRDWRVYVGCYRNDPLTMAAAMQPAGADPRVRLVVNPRSGPTTKADCLNRLFRALRDDEARAGRRYHGVLMHDAEDMVHPLALAVVDRALKTNDFVQLPVRPEFLPGSRWISGHYCDEFVEQHAKGLVVRQALGAPLPAAGVGCGFSRDILDRIAALRAGQSGEQCGGMPFAAECLTEDYELGVLIARCGGRESFIRLRDPQGRLVATASYFPGTLAASVRQKTRWIHGIALQGWDRLGWSRGLVENWMALRDRRGPLAALVLATAYLLTVLEGVLALLRQFGLMPAAVWSGEMLLLSKVCVLGCGWRLFMRFCFTASEYGLAEGLRSIPRMPVANIISIIAGRRAVFAYIRSLRGGGVQWDKTSHAGHPSQGPNGHRHSGQILASAGAA